ncbi:unnamed protein product [Oppiella nova]|uniref:GATA-type domain-containing protein n=1 Tax=Oppiella nova TaxID=334625 RepID=A0A7R9QXE5_9ACAR|nr:unnamed protein product [Oppiella nova]CAG2178397.1 unnamed protein product [Oppiella nova]
MNMNIKSDNNSSDRQCSNACGLYYRVNGDHRPHVSKISRVSTLRKSFLHCANCGTNKTTMWRRDAGGVHVCNACGLFFRINGFNRPVSMRRDVIRTRKRREKDLMQSPAEEALSNSASLDLSSIELSSLSADTTIKLEADGHLTPTTPSSTLSSPSTSSNESCNSYNYTDHPPNDWTPHHDVNPLTYIFTESMDYYNPEHTAIS